MTYNIKWVCKDLGIIPDSNCTQEFYKLGFQGSDGVSDELANEIKAQVVSHFKGAHIEYKDKIDNLDIGYLKNALGNTYKSSEE